MLVLALTSSVGAPVGADAHPGATKILSKRGSSPANGHTPARSVPDTTSPAMSLDGLTVAFSSDATNLVPGDTNGVADIFLRDAKGRISRVSTPKNGGQANGASYSPSLTVDGSMMAFVSTASNLVSGDTNGVADVFFKNLKTGYVYRVSELPNGTQANAASNSPFISLFGQWITFESEATNLSSNDTNGLSDAFLHTRSGRKMRRIVAPDTAEDDGLIDGVARTGSASISHDGRTLAYERVVVRTDPELPREANVCVDVPSVPNGPPEGHDLCPLAAPFASDVFVETKTLKKGVWKTKTQRIVMPPWGSSAGAARKMLENPVVTADGRYVAYEAYSVVTPAETAGLRPSVPQDAPEGFEDLQFLYDMIYEIEPLHSIEMLEDHNGLARNPYDQRTVYLFDHALKSYFPVSTNLAGPFANGDCYDASPNAYGTVVAFTCDASNMVAGDTNDAPDVFVKDLPGRATSRVSVSATHGEGFGTSNRPSISYDGRYVAFGSTVSTFVGGDSNSRDDVFMRDRRIDTVNRPPTLEAPFKKPMGVDALERVEFKLRGEDKDNDPLRYGAIVGLPDGARIDPVTGQFSWLPGPEHSEPGGRRWDIVLWVGDSRGTYSLESLALVTIVVRDPVGTARCELLGSNCEPVF